MSSPPRRIGRALTLGLLLSALLVACQPPRQELERTLVYGLTLAPSGIDPHLHASAELGIPLTSVYDTLVYRDPSTSAFVPGLARTWIISDDGLKYTFELRNDVHFHDGTPFNAEAVEANIDYTLNPDHHSFKAALMLGPLERVIVLGPYRVEFQLREPYAPLLDALAQVYLGMASPTALAAWGPVEYQFHQVGTGPYRFVEYIPNDHLTLTRSEDYAWAPDFYVQDNAEISTIEFRFFEDAATRALALESGQVDVIGEVPPLDARRLAAMDEYDLQPVPIPGQPLQFLFNTRLPPTNDRAVRQALIFAVDREDIVAKIFGPYSPVARGPLSAVMLDPPEGDLLHHDLQQAKTLLGDSGWVDEDGDGWREREGVPLELHIVAPPWGSNSEVAQLIRAAWEEVGARVSIEVASGFGPLSEAYTRGEFHAIGLNLFDTDPDLLRAFYAPEGRYNWTGYADTELGAQLLLASRLSTDNEKRTALYREISSLILDQALLLPIRDYVNLVVYQSQLKGLRFSAQGWFPLLIELHLEP